MKQCWRENKKGLIIEIPVEFNFKTNLGYLQRDKNECMFEIKDEKITRVIVVGEYQLLVEISAPETHELHVHFLAGTSPHLMENKDAVVQYIRDWFDLDRNLTPFYRMADRDPLLRPLVQTHHGLRIIGISDLFEALCWGVLGQQINLKFAYTLKRQFVEKFGLSVEYNGGSYWIFPTYEKVSKLTPEDMTDIKMTTRKSEYIIGIARLMARGNLSKEKLLKLNDFKKIENELVKIRGIGPWTANYVMMRCLRFPRAFPIDDVGLINSIQLLKEMDRKPTKKEILELSIPWENWEAYATFYLWRAKY